jgi:mono/diheme cytochrome c family protein
MLSYADKLSPEQVWDLVHYVRTLQIGRKSKENSVMAEAGGLKVLLPSQP